MSTLGCVRLLPLFRCRQASLFTGHNRNSFLLQNFTRRCSVAKPLQKCLTRPPPVFSNSLFRTQLLPKFSAPANSCSNVSRDSGNKNKTDNKEVSSNDFDLTSDPNKSLFRKFNENLKKYWYVMLPVHLVTSGAYFVGFCYLASIGVSPVPMLEQLGWFDEYLKSMKDSHLGILAVALIFQKLATPIRYLTTWYTVKALVGRGKLLTSSEFFALMADKYLKRKMKNK